MTTVPDNYVALPGSERRAGPSATLLGTADGNEQVTVTIVLRRRPDGPPMPDMSSYPTTIPAGRTRMTTEEFAGKYGAAPSDIAKVSDFVTAHGMTVVENHAARRTVIARGTVEQMNAAFGVTLGHYRHEVTRGRREGPRVEEYRGREGPIHIPNELASIITGVFGLDNRRVTKRNAGDPPNTGTLTVPQLARLYQFPTNSAAGQTIAIFSEAGYQRSDIAQYYATLPAGYTVPTLIDVSVNAGNSGAADAETTQDICIAATAAPGATIAVYFTTYDEQGWVNVAQRIAHPDPGDPDCSVLSSSFYVANGDDAATLAAENVSTSWLTALSAAFQDAAVQHLTVCIASGDTGTQSKIPGTTAHVQYPASDPWVLCIGGTTVGNINAANFDEYVWNDTFFGTAVGATGGGISDFFDPPSYQADADVPVSVNGTRRGRGIPDVAANASPNSGYPMFVGGGAFTANGTSASAPLWAGLIAVINAALGTRVGFVNPAIYAAGASAFRAIPAVAAAPDNGLNGVPGYPAHAGWDACTGWGSPIGTKLLAALRPMPAAVATPVSIAASALAAPPPTPTAVVTPVPVVASALAAAPPAQVPVPVNAVVPASIVPTAPRDTAAATWLLTLAAVVTAFATVWASGDFVKYGALYAWFIELAIVAGWFVALGITFKGYWFGVLVDARNKIALSRVQIVLWTILFTATFFVVYIWNVAHATDLKAALNLTVPDAVWVLMGISGISAVGTPLILSGKPSPSPGDAPPPAPADPSKTLDGIVVKRLPGARPGWSDIILGDEAGNADAIDISKLQQLVLSLVAVVAYAYAIGKTITAATNGTISALPGMEGGFLLLIAASHATYLGYKAVSHSN
jgi:kumamolisin